ncbi:hypothetical protein ACIQUX_13390 [Streptomyces sp. NPDC101133]|uniref:hypothetical protein n=1 Tax=Streptomyces sp. NPDC101133 TaxID=3366111 RepID=UPI00381E79B3
MGQLACGVRAAGERTQQPQPYRMPAVVTGLAYLGAAALAWSVRVHADAGRRAALPVSAGLNTALISPFSPR